MVEDGVVEENDEEAAGTAPAVVYSFGHDIGAPGQARRRLRPLVGSGQFGHDVTLVASELVTNAIRHTDDGGEMRAWDDDPLRLEVQDTSTNLPTTDAGREVGGNGMPIVDTLSTEWGADEVASGKVVWASFERPDGDT